MEDERVFYSEYEAQKYARQIGGQVIYESLESMGLWESASRSYKVVKRDWWQKDKD